MPRERDPRQEPPNPEDEGVPADEEHPARRRTDDAAEHPAVPGNRPMGLTERTTAAEQRRGDSHAERLAREVPDGSERRRDGGVPRLHTSEEGDGDDVKELVARETDDDVAPSAEEAAVHEERERRASG